MLTRKNPERTSIPPVIVDKEKSEQSQRTVGAYSVGDPPLPIPNRVVKPVCADGTWVDAQGE